MGQALVEQLLGVRNAERPQERDPLLVGALGCSCAEVARELLFVLSLSLFAVAAGEEFVDGQSSRLPCAHRLDHGRRAGHDVAAREDSSAACEARALVGDDVAVASGLQAGRGPWHEVVGAVADGDDRRIDLDELLAAGNRHRTPAAAVVRLTQFHPDDLDAADPSVATVDELKRGRERHELDALVLAVVNLLDPRGHLGL